MEEKNIEKQEKNKKPQKIENNKKKILALALALVLLIGGTYAWLSTVLYGKKTTRIEAGTLAMKINNESAGIALENALPITDEEGAELTPYEFTISNEGNVSSEYSVYLDKQGIDAETEFDMPLTKIKCQVTKTIMEKIEGSDNDAQVSTSTTTRYLSEMLEENSNTAVVLATSGKTGTTTTPLKAGQYIKFSVRLWIDETATNTDLKKKVKNDDGSEKILSAAYAAKLRLEAKQTGIEEDEAYAGQ